MAWRLNACERVSGPGPVEYAWHRINDPLRGPCKRITVVQDDRAMHGGPICPSYPRVHVHQKRPRAQRRIFASCVPLVIYAGVELNYASELPDMVLENMAVYLHAAPMNETLLAKTRSDQRLDQMYWDHEPGRVLDSPVVILVHVREDLLAVVRNGCAEGHVHLTDRTLEQKRVDILE
jgi:hypothetical protein